MTRTRLCVVKQHTTYDLYTVTGPDLRSILASSNFRSGPLGLWEAFDCEFRVVRENPDPECGVGRKYWQRYVEGWSIWPPHLVPEAAEDVDWSRYDIVVGIDIAVPARIVRAHPEVLWCHYFIEGGPEAIDVWAKGSPRFGYNVFLTQRLGKERYGRRSRQLTDLRKTRRCLLDAPYYLQSSRSVARVFGASPVQGARTGVCLSLHSQDVLAPDEQVRLEEFGPLRTPSGTLETVLDALTMSRYFVIHPRNKKTCGNALIEAVSAGCIALAPSSSLWGYPELVLPEVDYDDFKGLLEVVHALERDADRRDAIRAAQSALIDEWCYRVPTENLAAALDTFRSSPAGVKTQRRAERRSRVLTHLDDAGDRVLRGSRRLFGKG